MGGRGSSGGKYANQSVDSLQRKLDSTQQKLNKALQDRAVFSRVKNTSLKNLSRRANSNITRANKTIANTETEVRELKAAIEQAKRRKRAVPF